MSVLLSRIPPSQSDLLLKEWGYDLLLEYDEIVRWSGAGTEEAVELATGTGRLAAVLACRFPSVLSGDISLQELPRVYQRIPPERLAHVRFLQLDMERLPFADNSVPLLYCLNTLHETEHPHRCLDEMIRCIRPDGMLVAGDFNRAGFDAMQWIHSIVYHNDHPEGSILSSEIEQILRSRFRTVRVLDTALNRTFAATDKR
ncbi:MAG: class I SAM-dependent methyltransferase [Bacteroidetes bacterium]|nr:class I SAM-dependent methyltransferase [Bacteroidota bacterium]